MEFPESSDAFLREGIAVRDRLRSFKAATAVADYGWYPYESLSSLPVLKELMAPHYGEIREACRNEGVVDVGCADGDYAVVFGAFGCRVDAIDHRESNANQMRGVETAAREFCPAAGVYDLDLDGRFELPRTGYGLAVFLGTLYHLKNPYYILEKLAASADWCVLSTRIAQITPAGTRIESEPVAYLLGPREANDDPTNYWIFSRTGLRVTAERAGWRIVSEKRVGQLSGSDPVREDERIFMLLKSRTRFPELQVRALEGWHAPEEGGWRWTAKRFALEAILPESEPAREFALRVTVPKAVCEGGPVRIRCRIGGAPAGSLTCGAPDTLEFRGRLPDTAERGAALRLDFEVDSSFAPAGGDARDLGVIVQPAGRARGNPAGIPFRIS